MNETFQYRLSQKVKEEIAQNLIDILQIDAGITDQTRTFIYNWVLTDGSEKRKAFYDVWDIVLRNYLPSSRPILFRSCQRIGKHGKIASFTGRLECARRFNNGKGILILCDTKEELRFEEQLYTKGDYKHTFYPLVSLLEKARDSGGFGFTERFLNEYIGEDEYIMRVDVGGMHKFKWIKND